MWLAVVSYKMTVRRRKKRDRENFYVPILLTHFVYDGSRCDESHRGRRKWSSVGGEARFEPVDHRSNCRSEIILILLQSDPLGPVPNQKLIHFSFKKLIQKIMPFQGTRSFLQSPRKSLLNNLNDLPNEKRFKCRSRHKHRTQHTN